MWWNEHRCLMECAQIWMPGPGAICSEIFISGSPAQHSTAQRALGLLETDSRDKNGRTQSEAESDGHADGNQSLWLASIWKYTYVLARYMRYIADICTVPNTRACHRVWTDTVSTKVIFPWMSYIYHAVIKKDFSSLQAMKTLPDL